jgi:hypothetical protein
MPTDSRKIRVIYVPVHAAPRVELVERGPQGLKRMEDLIGADIFDSVLIARTKYGDTAILVDDDGIRRGKVPHFWARGAVLFGPLLFVHYDPRNGNNVDFMDAEVRAILEHAAKTPEPRPWLIEPAKCRTVFCPIPRGETEAAWMHCEKLRTGAINELRSQGHAVIERDRPDPFKKESQ